MIGFIGGGNMPTAIINGLIGSGFEKSRLMVYDVSPERQSYFSSIDIKAASDAVNLIEQSDTVVFGVKPQVFLSAIEDIDFSGFGSKLFISIMAGVTVAGIERAIGADKKIARVMPNTSMSVGKGAAAYCFNTNCTETDEKTVEAIFSSSAVTSKVEENMMSAVTALSGSGPAYLYLFVKCLRDAAVSEGMDEKTAGEFAVQTAFGAADMMKSSGDSLETLIRKVTSPNGTTQRALESFEASGLSETVRKAFHAAKVRADELSGN